MADVHDHRPGRQCVPKAINATGQVVGDVHNGSQTDAFLYSNGTLIDLGTRMLDGVSHGFLFNIDAAPATHGTGVLAASEPALVQVTATTEEAGRLLQPPLAPAGAAPPDQPATAPAAVAPGSSTVPPATDSPAGPGLTPTPLGLLNAADLDLFAVTLSAGA